MPTTISPRWQQITGMSEKDTPRARIYSSALSGRLISRTESDQYSLRTGDLIDVECRVRTSTGEWLLICSARSSAAGRRMDG